jgi:predicted MFS family arabinose efflux permease
LVPLVKAHLGLNEAQLGSLLLCLGLGSMIGMPFSGGLAGRFGCRTVILVAGSIFLAMLPILALAPSVAGVAAGLLVFGATIGTVDVVMNVQAVIVEKASGRAMMSGFHGLFSVGSIAGSAGMTGLLSLGVSPMVAISVVLGLAVLLLAMAARGLLTYGSEEASAAFALPQGRVLLIGTLCFISFLAEGSVLDWSAVLLETVRGLAAGQAGIGYVAFAATMTTGRLLGDAIVHRLGGLRVLVLGGLCASAGYALAAFAPSPWASVLGFALVGAGASNVVPVLFTAAGRQTSMPSNLAIAAVTTMGYAGLLIGPAAIGYVAHASNLPGGLSLVALLLLVIVFSARKVTAAPQ